MNHEEFSFAFANQMKVLKTKGCPERVLLELIGKQHALWQAINPIHRIVPRPGFYLFMPVIPFGVISETEQAHWLNGVLSETIPGVIFQKFQRPAAPYFITAVSDGREYINARRSDVVDNIEGSGRFPCSDEELFAIRLHGVDSVDQSIEALNTRYGAEKKFVPFIVNKGLYKVPTFHWDEQRDVVSPFSSPSIGGLV